MATSRMLPADDESVLRILDVNLNRAREALRVIEDHARFTLDDADLAATAKALRHALREIAQSAGGDALLAARDIENDVGRDAHTDAELQRGSSEDVVRAALGRLSEAARSLGEYGKLVSRETALRAEAVRCAAYELEQRILLRGALRRRFRDVRLYVIVTENLCRRPWEQTAEAALHGGATCIQLREKSLPDAELLRRAARLRRLSAAHGALLIINDRPDVAWLCGADGVHVGQEDLPVREARRIVGPRLLIGRSTHTVEQIDVAIAERPDYIAVGPMFASATKPSDAVAGARLLAEAARRTQIPLVAIGGVTAGATGALIGAGASCVCACAAVIGAEDAETAAREIIAAAGAVRG
jgi:thiamine-phosphate pyrophosphorylase